MAKNTPVVAFIAVLVFMLSQAMATTEVGFFYLVLMWPGAYCTQTRGGCCLPKNGKPEIDFFVKGLLPYTEEGISLAKCTNSTYNPNEILDLNDDLSKYWPNIKCPRSKNQALWRNSWKTYGICSDLTEHDYFKKSLELHANINMLSIFKDKDIVPDGTYYSLSEFEDAILQRIGVKAALRCTFDKKRNNQLSEIYVCVDKDAKTIIPCPYLPKFTCDPRVVFNSFSYDMLKIGNSLLTTNPIQMRVEK